MAAVRIETAELGLPAVDALETDALAVFVGPERPLQGLAGFVDWRLCGLLSRAIRDGSYDPDAGETLLLPSGGRLLVPRIFCFGTASPPRDAASFSVLVRRLCHALHKAGSASWAGALPDVARHVSLPGPRLFLQALLPVPPRSVVLLGDAHTLQRDLVAAREALGGPDVEIVSPSVRVEMPGRAARLHHPGAVIR